MQIVASVRGSEPRADLHRAHVGTRLEDVRAYRARLAALRTRAPDTLRARIRRELRAAAQQAARR